MADKQETVRTGAPAASRQNSYHHGSLRAELISVAETLIAERGLDQFSLRETARRAGVSPAAPAHHFGDASGLLTAIAIEGFLGLADALEQAAPGADRATRLRAQAAAYVQYSIEQRARFDVMWRKGILRADDPALDTAGKLAFNHLDEVVRGGAAAAPLTDPALAPSIACWSIVHGFARLALDGAFGTDEGAAERAAATLLPLVLSHLQV